MAGNSKDSKILAYKDMINQLNKTISAQTELIQSLQKTLEADRLEKENLRQQIEYLMKKLFGTSSEKRKDIDGQLNLFDEAEQEYRNIGTTGLLQIIVEAKFSFGSDPCKVIFGIYIIYRGICFDWIVGFEFPQGNRDFRTAARI